ncbi:class I SAM-dependent methyltransferase [Pedobacter gandavensis]|uniref:class I SAM-dependent methyltransferase n=1 Tax=Pedobacter gandavensis TaxID=2679963 RepID=UPI00292D4232|nr:class I SAM-dependent methyltransferase [Pedobacter gandavensis]
MKTDYLKKASNEEIKARFDQDVERFSNLESGQQTTIDAPLTMELCSSAAKYISPDAKELLDIGCGAGNYTLKMLSKIPDLNCTLNDLSLPMLERAKERVSLETTGRVTLIQEDMRNLNLAEDHFDIVLAAATFHHLRTDADWELVFTKIYRALKLGGSIWISDLITHDSEQINRLFQDKYRMYLETLDGPEYAQKVFDYIAYEDTPRSLNYQLDLMAKVGFKGIEILHKNSCFAAFGGMKVKREEAL